MGMMSIEARAARGAWESETERLSVRHGWAWAAVDSATEAALRDGAAPGDEVTEWVTASEPRAARLVRREGESATAVARLILASGDVLAIRAAAGGGVGLVVELHARVRAHLAERACVHAGVGSDDRAASP